MDPASWISLDLPEASIYAKIPGLEEAKPQKSPWRLKCKRGGSALPGGPVVT